MAPYYAVDTPLSPAVRFDDCVVITLIGRDKGYVTVGLTAAGCAIYGDRQSADGARVILEYTALEYAHPQFLEQLQERLLAIPRISLMRRLRYLIRALIWEAV